MDAIIQSVESHEEIRLDPVEIETQLHADVISPPKAAKFFSLLNKAFENKRDRINHDMMLFVARILISDVPDKNISYGDTLSVLLGTLREATDWRLDYKYYISIQQTLTFILWHLHSLPKDSPERQENEVISKDLYEQIFQYAVDNIASKIAMVRVMSIRIILYIVLMVNQGFVHLDQKHADRDWFWKWISVIAVKDWSPRARNEAIVALTYWIETLGPTNMTAQEFKDDQKVDEKKIQGISQQERDLMRETTLDRVIVLWKCVVQEEDDDVVLASWVRLFALAVQAEGNPHSISALTAFCALAKHFISAGAEFRKELLKCFEIWLPIVPIYLLIHSFSYKIIPLFEEEDCDEVPNFALGETRGIFLSCLDDPDPSVRFQFVLVLSKIISYLHKINEKGYRKHIKSLLLDCLEDQDDEVAEVSIAEISSCLKQDILEDCNFCDLHVILSKLVWYTVTTGRVEYMESFLDHIVINDRTTLEGLLGILHEKHSVPVIASMVQRITHKYQVVGV